MKYEALAKASMFICTQIERLELSLRVKRSNLVFSGEIAAHLSGARNDLFIRHLRSLIAGSGIYLPFLTLHPFLTPSFSVIPYFACSKGCIDGTFAKSHPHCLPGAGNICLLFSETLIPSAGFFGSFEPEVRFMPSILKSGRKSPT